MGKGGRPRTSWHWESGRAKPADVSPQGAWTLPYLQPGAASRRRERQAAAERLPFPSRLIVWPRADQLSSGLPASLAVGGGGLTGDLTGFPALTGGRVLTTSPPSLAFQFPIISYYGAGIRVIYTFSHYHLLG